MTIGDRISMLRRSRDMSQEELAERCGVSRQAVSKWESEQSMPEIEKIMALSEIFGVTTDYLLKGIEPLEELPVGKKRPAKPYDIVATALIFLGVAIGIFISVTSAESGLVSALAAFVFVVIGITAFELGMVKIPKRDQKRNAFEFARANVWAIALLVFSLIYNAAVAHMVLAFPLPLTGSRLIWGYSETVQLTERPNEPATTIYDPQGDDAADVAGKDSSSNVIRYKTVYHESYYSKLPGWVKEVSGAAFVILYVLTCAGVTVWATAEIERERKKDLSSDRG